MATLVFVVGGADALDLGAAAYAAWKIGCRTVGVEQGACGEEESRAREGGAAKEEEAALCLLCGSSTGAVGCTSRDDKFMTKLLCTIGKKKR